MATLEPPRIVSRAFLVLQELLRSEIWAAGLDKVTIAAAPLLVTSIEPPVPSRHGTRRKPADYYIVSVGREGAITARFAHHAETGDLLEVEAIKVPGTQLRPYTDPGLEGGSVVWRPCRESTTRFLPFWRVHIQGRTVYVRADGERFDELTTTGRG